MSKFVDVSVEVTVTITIADNAPDDVITRMQNDPDTYESLYGEMNHNEVCQHWAYNAVSNGVKDAKHLDGWADLDPGMVTFDVSDIDAREVYP